MLRMYWTRCELTGKLQARWVRGAAPTLPASPLRRHTAGWLALTPLLKTAHQPHQNQP